MGGAEKTSAPRKDGVDGVQDSTQRQHQILGNQVTRRTASRVGKDRQRISRAFGTLLRIHYGPAYLPPA